ncbi:MAG: DUF4982 domain-containing protein, partial [Alistipes sp.]|nr:DUF4982 domain-containing protein [Alistipes sp.]
MDQFDIAGYNYIDRIHPDSLYAAEHARYPQRILLGTETYHKSRNHCSVRDTPSCIGEFVWVGYDYLGEIVWPDYRGWNEGILDIAGFPKPEYYLRQSYWSEQPIVHLGVEQSAGRDFDWSPRDLADHWNWAARQGDTLNLYVYSNCEEVELRLGHRSLGRKKVDPNTYYALWQLPFKAGTLRAIGYRAGKAVAEHALQSAGAPSQIEATRIYRGKDVTRVEIQVSDKQSTRVPDFEGVLHLSGSTDAILGVENGNQHDPQGVKYTSKTQLACYQGRMVIYLKPGAAQLTLTTDGIAPQSLQIP